MPSFRIQTPSEQVADYLREKILSGYYRKVMPGKSALAREMGVDAKTAGLALELLEKEKLLLFQGAGRPRRIVLSRGRETNGLKIMILCYEARDRQIHYIVELVHQLIEQGHQVSFAKRSLVEMKMDIREIGRLTKGNPADAWIVMAGSVPVLEWFSRQPFPCFALFGRTDSAEIASTGVRTHLVYQGLIDRLVELGHQRIVFLVREERRKPSLGRDEKVFLECMRSHGIKVGNYNIPDWEESVEGFHDCLDALFSVTPPTVLIADQPELFIAAQQHLLARGTRIPEDVSLISTNYDYAMSWCKPSVAHFVWDPQKIIRHVLRWAANTAQGKKDLKKSFVKPTLIDGGTIGPAPKE
jgi:DNA-binding LacI/PurR family transcriptional regulator